MLSVGSCASRARHPGGGWPPVGRQDVLFIPRSGQPLPHHGVPTRRLVFSGRKENNCFLYPSAWSTWVHSAVCWMADQAGGWKQIWAKLFFYFFFLSKWHFYTSFWNATCFEFFSSIFIYNLKYAEGRQICKTRFFEKF